MLENKETVAYTKDVANPLTELKHTLGLYIAFEPYETIFEVNLLYRIFTSSHISLYASFKETGLLGDRV